MVPFAGYEMPVQYPMGVMAEHLHTRTAAGLFDVSHMGQLILQPAGGMDALCAAFEALMPVDVMGLRAGRQRYGLLTNDEGGIIDDLMFANRGDHLFVVVNAGCKAGDIAHLTAHLGTQVRAITDRALLALVDTWLASLNAEAFQATLPLLRRTFGSFSAPERSRIAASVAQGPAAPAVATAPLDLDVERALPAVAAVARLFGRISAANRSGETPVPTTGGQESPPSKPSPTHD